MKNKKVCVSVINDVFTDQRIHKVCISLEKAGYSPFVIGRQFANSPKIQRSYKVYRFRFLFSKGPFFYFFYNLRLLIYLLFSKVDILLANDLDTLLANYLVHRIKGTPLVYDSHELFTEVPELQNRRFAKFIWLGIEKWILPKLKSAYTVSPKIRDYYFKKYKLKMGVIYNFPHLGEESIKLPEAKENVIIYQGALNIGRGLEELIEAMQFLEGYFLHIFGIGDIEHLLKRRVKELKLHKVVRFFGRLSPEELLQHTEKAKIGVSIEKSIGMSYTYAIPNKVFDYLKAGIPVYRSNLEEVDKLLIKEVGLILNSYEPNEIANDLKTMINSPKYKMWCANAIELSRKCNWESQEDLLLTYFE